MNLPGFTAEASMNNAERAYSSDTSSTITHDGAVVTPQACLCTPCITIPGIPIRVKGCACVGWTGVKVKVKVC